jgi:ABC-2 type transport system permease protein
MQVRRPSLWVAVGALGVLIAGSDVWREFTPGSGFTAMALTMSRWVFEVSTWVPPVLAMLLADRLVRDRRLRVEELLDGTSASRGARLWGKYIGVCAAACVPVAALWAIGVVEIALHYHAWVALPLGVAALAAVVLPAIMFVAAVSLAVPTIVGATFFRIVFVVYWIAGNMLIVDGVPNLSHTWLTPIGKYARDGLMGRAYKGSPWDTGATALAGAGSVAVIVGVSLAVVALLQIGRRARTRRAV